MKNKILISTLMLLLCVAFLCSYSFATTNMLQSAGNTVMNAGNAIGNAAGYAGNSLVNGTRSLTNGAANLGSDMMDGMTDTTRTTTGAGTTDYTATRTATTNTGLFGMSDTMSTWLILGVVGAIIVGLIWYYGAQYEHREYNND